MDIYGTGSQSAEPYFRQLDLGFKSYDELDTVNLDTMIIVHDIDNTCTKESLNKILSKGSSIIYLFNEPNEANIRFLISKNCYSVFKCNDTLTLDFILKLIEEDPTLEYAQKFIKDDIRVNSLSEIVSMIDSFLIAIDNKDEQVLTDLFTNSFEDMRLLSKAVSTTLSENNILNKKVSELTSKLNSYVKDLEELNNRHDSLILAGRKTEEHNVKLLEIIEGLKTELVNKDSNLIDSKEEILSQSNSIRELEKEKDTLQSDLKDLTIERNSIKVSHDKTLKEFETLAQSLAKTNLNIENIEILLTSTGKVEKILYLKVYEMVPNIIECINTYPKYAVNRCKLDGCSVFIILPKSSAMYLKYKNKYKTFDDLDVDTYEDGIYIIDGYTEKVESYIQKINSQALVILDMTLRSSVLVKSVRQKVLSIIDSEEMIDNFRLNPTDCISYSNLSELGITARIPDLTGDKSMGTKLKMIRETFYVILDTVWR